MLIKDVKDKKYRNILIALRNDKTVTQACKDEGIAPQSFYKWKNASPERAELYNNIKDVLSDKVEMALYEKCVKDKDVNAIKFWLTNLRGEKWANKSTSESKSQINVTKSPKEVKDEIQNIFGLSEDDMQSLESVS